MRVVVSDDGSSDGTLEWLQGQAAADPRITLLPSKTPTGSAAANFYRLILEAELDDRELIALSDQDDIWHAGKLAGQAKELSLQGLDGVSADVLAFDEAGHKTLIRKSYPQRRFDYLLESPGPGSTFLMTPRLVERVRTLLRDPSSAARAVDYHDWLIYAVARASGWSWQIQDIPQLDYRQHATNSMGANSGLRPGINRLRLISRHWHRQQAHRLSLVALSVADDLQRASLIEMELLLRGGSLRRRWALVSLAGQLRRRRRDQWIIGVLLAIGLW